MALTVGKVIVGTGVLALVGSFGKDIEIMETEFCPVVEGTNSLGEIKLLEGIFIPEEYIGLALVLADIGEAEVYAVIIRECL